MVDVALAIARAAGPVPRSRRGCAPPIGHSRARDPANPLVNLRLADALLRSGDARGRDALLRAVIAGGSAHAPMRSSALPRRCAQPRPPGRGARSVLREAPRRRSRERPGPLQPRRDRARSRATSRRRARRLPGGRSATRSPASARRRGWRRVVKRAGTPAAPAAVAAAGRSPSSACCWRAAVLAVRWRSDHARRRASCSSPSTRCAPTASAPTAPRRGLTPQPRRAGRARHRLRGGARSVPLTLPSHATHPQRAGAAASRRARQRRATSFPRDAPRWPRCCKAPRLRDRRVRRRLRARPPLRPGPRLRPLRRRDRAARRRARACSSRSAAATRVAARRRGAGSAQQPGPSSPGSTSTIRTRPTTRPRRSASSSAGRPYDGEIAVADACLGRVAAARGARAASGCRGGADRRPRRGAGRARRAHPRLLRLPVDAARARSSWPAPGVRAARARPGSRARVDILPTILAAARGARRRRGPRRRRPARPQRRARGGYAETLYPATLGWAPLRALRVGALKLHRRAAAGALRPRARIPARRATSSSSAPADARRLRSALDALRRRERGRRRGTRATIPRSPSGCARSATWRRSRPAASAPATGLRDPKDAARALAPLRGGDLGRRARRARGGGRAAPRRWWPSEPGNACSAERWPRRCAPARLEPRTRRRRWSRSAPPMPLAWHERAVSLAEQGDVAEALLAEAPRDRAQPAAARAAQPSRLLARIARASCRRRSRRSTLRAGARSQQRSRVRQQRATRCARLGRTPQLPMPIASGKPGAARSRSAQRPRRPGGAGRRPRARPPSFSAKRLRREPRYQEARLNLAVAEGGKRQRERSERDPATSLLPPIEGRPKLRARALSLQRSRSG